MKKLTIQLAVFCFFCFVAAQFGYTQGNRTRVIERGSREEPVEITGLRIEGRAVNLLDRVPASRNWLNSLSLRIRNNYHRPIVYMNVELEIPKSGSMEYPYRVPITFGTRSPAGRPAQPGDRPAERIQPGRIQELSISEYMRNALANFLAENQVEEVDSVKVFFEFILFDDEVAWSGGQVMQRNPNNPEEWVVTGVWQNGPVFFNRPESRI